MWAVLTNHTPFAAERALLCDRDGSVMLVVAVRATYDVGPQGTLTLAAKQQPVALLPRYRGEPGRSSLLFDTDLVVRKVTTDVLVLGQAHAPGGQAATTVQVTLQVGDLVKRLQVTGNRTWLPGPAGELRATDPEPFVTLPLLWELAYGGSESDPDKAGDAAGEPRNPVGRGFAPHPSLLPGRPLPNITYPGGPTDLPAGLGPVAREWSSRARWAGTCDQAWQEDRFPILPEDFDDRFYQCAPEDQQPPSFLTGGEHVVLENLTPSGRLELHLPRVLLAFRTDLGQRSERHLADIHTVILEPDILRLQVVWQTHLPCHEDHHRLGETTIQELPDLDLGGRDAVVEEGGLLDGQPTLTWRGKDTE